MINSLDIVTIKNNEYSSIFLNTTKQPDKIIQLDYYKYHDNDFFRLYQEEYLFDNLFNYSIKVWRRINVKNHCKQAFKNQVDGMTAMSEFIQD